MPAYVCVCMYVCAQVWLHLANKTTCAEAFEVCVHISPFVHLLHNEYANLSYLSNKCGGQTHVVCQRNHNHKSDPLSQVESEMFWAAQWEISMVSTC